MDKYTIAPPSGSTQNSVGAEDRPWHEGHFDSVKLNGGDLGSYLAESTGYGIVSGCEPSISGLTVTVGAGVVHLADGTRKEIVQTNITLDNADPTKPRIDLVYINADGEVAKVTGTAEASPVVPSVPANGISVAQVSVAAGATTGTVNRVQTIAPNLANYGIVNVKDFGAVGDGTHDDTAAIQTAIDNNPNSLVYIPTGQYKITSTIKVIAPIVGDGYMRDAQNKENGTWIINDSDGYAFEINSSSNLNLFISRLSVYCNNDNGGIYADMDKHNLYHFEELGIFNVATYGMNIRSTVGSSREVFMRDITIFGSFSGYRESTAIYLDGNSYDSRLTNIEIMGTQTGIVGTGVLYGSNWHIWLGDMNGKTNNQWWLDTTAIILKENPFLEVTNLYIDSARTGISTSGGIIIVSNLIWMNDENIAVDDTSDKADGLILWNNTQSTRPVTGAITNCELHLSPHANLPFVNGGWYQSLRVSNVAVDFALNTNYESLAVSHSGNNSSLSLPNSTIYDVEYAIENVPLNAANIILIGKIVTLPSLYGVAEIKLQMDSVYVGSIFIKIDNGAYVESRVETKFGSGFHFYISSFTNRIASIYAKYPLNFPANAYGFIKCPKSRNIGFLDLNATIGGNKYDFTTDVTDISTLTELGV